MAPSKVNVVSDYLCLPACAPQGYDPKGYEPQFNAHIVIAFVQFGLKEENKRIPENIAIEYVIQKHCDKFG